MYRIFKFDLAREALKYIIQIYKIKQMHIPYYLCDVVRHTLSEENCKPIFYHIDDNFYPTIKFSNDNYILYPNYWGVNGKNVKKLVSIYPKLIVDNAHAYYDEPSGFACFNAGHKFGYQKSYLWLNESIFTNDESVYEIRNTDDLNLRKQYFLKLHKKYKSINTLEIDLESIPFCYPCVTETEKDADNLVKILKEEGKTIYRYWNPLPKSFLEYKFYSRLVPIPILPD